MVTNNSGDYSPTQYNVQTGGANGTLNDVSPSTSGFILTSNGVAAQPTFQAPAASSITIAGDTGSHTGSSFTFNGPIGGGKTVSFAVSGSTVDWKAGDSGNNVAIGPSAGPVTYSGTSNTALGNLAQASTTISGSSNTSVGDSTLSTLSTGSNNTAVGISSCHSLTTGHENTAYGRSSLNSLTTGVDNIAIGNVAGSNYFTSESNNIVIGNSGTTAESNVIRIGVQGSGSGQQSTCYIAGIEGVSVSNKNIVTIDTTSGQLGSDATVAVAQGGTGAATLTGILTGNGTSAITGNAVTQHGVLIGGASNAASSLSVATTGTVLMGNTGADPSFSTATYPSTTTSQQILYSTANNVVGQLTTANSKLPATNSAGTLAMRAFSVVTQVFTTTGTNTYTPTSGMLYCIMEVQAGGGGSGGAATAAAGQYSTSIGGGGGGYSRKTVSAATVGASQTVTVGAGGTAGTAGNNAGGTGGTSSVGAILSATGGAGGTGGASSVNFSGAGVAGGVGSSGDINIPGGASGAAFHIFGTAGMGSFGGNSYFAGVVQAVAVAAGQGVVGYNYGGGASGNSLNTGTGNTAGQAGGQGIVVITEYVIA